MNFKWIVPGPNAKVLANAIHCLAKLGDDLYLEGRADKLIFRTVNMPKTAFASFSFHPDFFSFYPIIPSDEGPRCHVSMKAALIVFRSPSGMDRSVENCAVVCCEDKVELRIKFKAGFVKTNKIPLVEAEVLHANYEDEELPGRIVMDGKVLTSLLNSFHSHEITWAVSHSGIQFRNFSELQDDAGGLRSEVYVGRDELLELKPVGEDDCTELTFCLTELRTVLAFAEQINCPLISTYTATGRPMYFILTNEIVTTHVVLSTLGASTQSELGSQPPRVSASQSELGSQPPRVSEFGSQPPRAASTLSQALPSQPQGRSADLESSQQRLHVLHHVLHRPLCDVTQLPGYHEVLAPDSDEEL